MVHRYLVGTLHSITLQNDSNMICYFLNNHLVVSLSIENHIVNYSK